MDFPSLTTPRTDFHLAEVELGEFTSYAIESRGGIIYYGDRILDNDPLHGAERETTSGACI